MLSQLCGLRSRMIRVRAARGKKPQPAPPRPSTGLVPLLAGPAMLCSVADRAMRPPPPPPPAQLTGLVVTEAECNAAVVRRSMKAAADDRAPRSTEPPISGVPAARRAACWSSGWLAIRSTSSKSSVEERPELTKAVSNTWWAERWWRRDRLRRQPSELEEGGGGEDGVEW